MRRSALTATALSACLLLPTAANAAATPDAYNAVGANWHRARVARLFGSHGWREAHWQQAGHAVEVRGYPTSVKGAHVNVVFRWCRRDQAWEVRAKEWCTSEGCWS